MSQSALGNPTWLRVTANHRETNTPENPKLLKLTCDYGSVITELLAYDKAGAVISHRVAQDRALHSAYILLIHLQVTS